MINNVGDIIVFLGLTVFNTNNFYFLSAVETQVTFVEKLQFNSFQNFNIKSYFMLDQMKILRVPLYIEHCHFA